jgi:hypothetical protein
MKIVGAVLPHRLSFVLRSLEKWLHERKHMLAIWSVRMQSTPKRVGTCLLISSGRSVREKLAGIGTWKTGLSFNSHSTT